MIKLIDTTPTHYLVSDNGKEELYDRVTSVINSVWGYAGRTDPVYATFGKQVHEVTSWYDNGTLDEKSLGDDLLKDYLDGYKKCKSETIWMKEGKVVLNEAFMFSHKHKVAGTIDRLWFYNGKYYLPDTKSSRPDKVKAALQTAAYKMLVQEMLGGKFPVDWRGAIELRENDYRLHEYSDEDDLDCFLACLKLKNRKSRKVKRKKKGRAEEKTK